jgi:hypothetical protein
MNKQQFEIFLVWVEQTKLFNVIREETRRQGKFGIMPSIVGVQPDLSLSLVPGVVIDRAVDLPKEFLAEFFRNSPFYDGNDSIDNDLKLLE